jgi:hypothetical protein
MAITKKVDGLIVTPVGKNPMAPIVRAWAVTVDSTAGATQVIEAGLDGFAIPVGGLIVMGSIGAGTVAIQYNGSAAMYTAASPSATVPNVNTAGVISLPGTAAATAAITITTAGTITAGTVYITALLIPVCSSAKTPGVGY